MQVVDAMQFVAHRLPADRLTVQSYGPGGFTISGVRYHSAVLLTTTRLWPVPIAAMPAIRLELFAPLFEAGIEVDLLLLGTGAAFALPPPDLLQALRARRLAVEAMTTPAACRTFNLLASEERRVAALLLTLP